jgi:Tol biopolymer transport system component
MSRDGTKAGLDRVDPQDGNRDVWVMDLAQGTSTRLTFDPASDASPVFSPDGSRVVFLSSRGGRTGLYSKASNGAGTEELLLKPGPRALFDWSPDGRFLVYGSGNPSNIWLLPVNGDHTGFPFFKTQFTETPARLSPDGRFIGYRSDESGRNEIYVKAFTPAPNAGMSAAKWVVSKDGGVGMVHWRKDGKELYYLAANGDVMAVDVNTTPTFHSGTPKALFAVPQAFLRVSATPGNLAAVAPDGQRFLFAMPVGQSDREELGVIVNWQALLKGR